MYRAFLSLAISVAAVPALAQSAIEGLPAGTLVFDADPEAAAVTQSLASTRSPTVLIETAEPAEPEIVLDPVVIAPQIDLAPGETIVRTITTPAIVKIPNPEPAYVIDARAAPAPRTAPEPVVDPVTGRLRDTPGWTGRTDGPASIGCFPAGACSVLNEQ